VDGQSIKLWAKPRCGHKEPVFNLLYTQDVGGSNPSSRITPIIRRAFLPAQMEAIASCNNNQALFELFIAWRNKNPGSWPEPTD
jgi:hypothetical protein